jgi:hypothetical protein
MDDVIGDLKNHTIPEEKDFVVSRIGGEIDVKAPKNRRREKEAAQLTPSCPSLRTDIRNPVAAILEL